MRRCDQSFSPQKEKSTIKKTATRLLFVNLPNQAALQAV
jgi:hypothetical protein